MVMVWSQWFCGVVLQILRIQLFPSPGTTVIISKATVGVVHNIFEISCVPLVLHYLINLLLCFSHCIIISADCIEGSYFLWYPPGNSTQEAIPLRKLPWRKPQLMQDSSPQIFPFLCSVFLSFSPSGSSKSGPLSKVWPAVSGHWCTYEIIMVLYLLCKSPICLTG